MSNEKTTPIAVEKFTDNGEFSHYDIVDQTTGKVIWSSPKPSPTPLSAEEIIKFYLDSDRTKISIQNCMEGYASQQTAQLRQQVEELRGDVDVYKQDWKVMNDEIKSLKERSEKMERAAQDFLKEADDLMTFCVDQGYLDPEDESIDGIKTFNEAFEKLQQSLNKE